MNKIDALQLARELLKEHNLGHYSVVLSQRRRNVGRCYRHSNKIALSAHWIACNDEAFIKGVILHEIAHALAPPQAEHNHEWREIALSIGCNGLRLVQQNEGVRPQAKWIATCRKCGEKHIRHRMTRNNKCCGVCMETYDPEYILVFKLNPDYK